MNQKKSIALTTTFVGLVCGFVLTQQQAAAAATNTPDPTATSMVAPQSTATAQSAEPTQKEQPVNQQTSTQKAVTSTNTVNETVNQDQTSRPQSTVSPATNTAEQTTTVNNNTTNSAQPQQVASSSASKANETTQPVSQPTAPAATDPQQVETIAQGTWGTSKWEYTHQGDDYILHFHAGTLGASNRAFIDDTNYPYYHELGSIGASPEVFNGNWQWNDELTQIIIDPGIIAHQDSSYLFGYLKKLQKIIGLANLDTTNVTNMSYMFEDYQGASLDLSQFDTANVTDMSGMFEFYQGPQLNFSNFDTSNVKNMSDMFEFYQGPQLDFSHFNTANVTDMSGMFADYQGPHLDFSHFNTANVTDMSYMFKGYEGPQLDFSHFNTANVTDMSDMFEGYEGPQLDLSHFNTANVTDMSEMFKECDLTSLDLSNLNTANVTDMYEIFRNCRNLNSLNLSNWDNENITDMHNMFYNCCSLTNLNLSNFHTTNVTDMSWMFYECNSLTSLDLSSFNTAKVTNMEAMFSSCSSLTSLDLSNFNTANVDHMRYMFGDCMGLTSLDLSNFDLSKIEDMDSIFHYCRNLNHLILGPKTEFKYVYLPKVPDTGTRLLDTDRVVASPYWVATSGYQQGHKYTSTELMELTGRDQVTTYDWDSKPAFTQTTETQTKVRTINIYRPNGQIKTYLQTAVISRPVTINADGSKTYGNWSTDQWEAYVVPELQGYTASQTQVAAQSVDPNTTDQTIDIFYAPQEQTVEVQYLANGQVVGTQKFTGYTGDTIMPNYHAPQGYEITSATPATITIDSSGKQIVQVQVSPKLYYSNEHKIITRVINVHFPSGRIQTYEQTALLERPVTINAVTGAKTYGSWNTGNWNALDVPVLDGYTASQDQVAAQQVTDQDSDQTVDVYYTPTN